MPQSLELCENTEASESVTQSQNKLPSEESRR